MNSLHQLALTGLLGGVAVSLTSCKSNHDDSMNEHTAAVQSSQYSEIHACAGHNTCKGLGGCAVDAKKLAQLASAAGMSVESAGAPHGCAGMNECKGLGGCSVDAAKLAKLKQARGY